MALSANLPLTRLSSGTAATFKLIAQDLTQAKRIDETSTSTEPLVFLIKHQVTNLRGTGKIAVDRHLVQFMHTKVTSAQEPYTGIVNLTVQQPRVSVISNSVMLDLMQFAVNFMNGTGNKEALLIGDR